MIDSIFTDSAISKIIDFILEEPQLDYSKKDIAKKAGVSWKTVDNVLPKLELFGILEYSRRVSKAQMYKVNTNSRVFKALKYLDFELSDITLSNQFKSKKAPTIKLPITNLNRS